MAGKKTPGPVCQVEIPICIDDGTMCRAETPLPGPNGMMPSVPVIIESRAASQPATGQAVQATQSVSISLGAEMSWESYVREVYNQGAKAIRGQAEEFVRTGRMTAEEAKVWSNGQRNALMQACRDKSSPLGKAIAEAIKPKGKTVADLEKLGKSAEGIIESAGKTNPYVNRLAVGFRYAGPALLVVGLSFSAYHIATAPESERWRVTAQEAGTWGGALAGGYVGGMAGCKIVGGVVTFVAPGPGTGVGCLVGGFVGTVGGAIAGSYYGSQAGEYVYTAVSKE